jgi:diguanylate cyclase (GGDEF)-like protein
MLLPDTSLESGSAFAQAICDRVRSAAFGSDDPTVSITVSIGLAGAPDGATLEELLLAADRRLYLAKDGGRDQVIASDRPTPRVDAWRRDQPRMLVPV